MPPKGPGRLVDEDDPARLEPLRRHQPAAAAETNSRRRNSVISAIDSSLENPAALNQVFNVGAGKPVALREVLLGSLRKDHRMVKRESF